MRLFDLIIDIDNLVRMNNRLIEKFISNKYYNFSSNDIVIDCGLAEVFKNVGNTYEQLQDEDSLCEALSKHTDDELLIEFQKYYDFLLVQKSYYIDLLRKQKILLENHKN
jgi:hypothetical protein